MACLPRCFRFTEYCAAFYGVVFISGQKKILSRKQYVLNLRVKQERTKYKRTQRQSGEEITGLVVYTVLNHFSNELPFIGFHSPNVNLNCSVGVKEETQDD